MDAKHLITVLFARRDSNYKTLPGVDVWDADRDALKWPGGTPIVAHPPCRGWGQLRFLAKPTPGELALAPWAVVQVRKFGGVLEHPNRSILWPTAGLPEPRSVDKFGGWTLPISQHWWGHKAEKLTRLYIVGCRHVDVPDMPFVLGESSHVIAQGNRKNKRRPRPEVTKVEREHTPILLAEWLVELARRCRP